MGNQIYFRKKGIVSSLSSRTKIQIFFHSFFTKINFFLQLIFRPKTIDPTLYKAIEGLLGYQLLQTLSSKCPRHSPLSDSSNKPFKTKKDEPSRPTVSEQTR
jgi:hypothetical protein